MPKAKKKACPLRVEAAESRDTNPTLPAALELLKLPVCQLAEGFAC